MYDISELDPEDIPCCPLCGQPILDWEEFVVESAHGCRFLAHTYCANPEE